MIIGLKGLKGSGKDTVAAYLIKQHNFERRAFADPLKKSVAALLDIPYHEIDKWKNDPEILVGIYRDEHDGYNWAVSGKAPITFREFLQRYGTESHRDIFGENFWLDFTLPTDGYYAGRKIVITDCRFENEARRVTASNGYVVQIRRPGHEAQDQHRSEELFPLKMVDYELINDAGLEELYDRIETMLMVLASEEREIGRLMAGG